MANFKISVDEDILLIKTSKSVFNALVFFKHWSYQLELPTYKITHVKVIRRFGVLTLEVVKVSKNGPDKHIMISLARASKKQVNFMRHALPKIIKDRPPMGVINQYISNYIKKEW